MDGFPSTEALNASDYVQLLAEIEELDGYGINKYLGGLLVYLLNDLPDSIIDSQLTGVVIFLDGGFTGMDYPKYMKDARLEDFSQVSRDGAAAIYFWLSYVKKNVSIDYYDDVLNSSMKFWESN